MTCDAIWNNKIHPVIQQLTRGTTIDHKNVDACQKPIVILQCSKQPLNKGTTDGELKVEPSPVRP